MGAALRGWPASSDFGCGGRGPYFLGVVPILADLVLENRTCAPPLPRGVGVVGGVFMAPRGEKSREKWKASKGGTTGHRLHRREPSGAATSLFGKGVRPGADRETNQERSRSSNRRGARSDEPDTSTCHLLHGAEEAQWERTVTISPARLLLLCPCHRCRLTPAAVGVFSKLMGLMPHNHISSDISGSGQYS